MTVKVSSDERFVDITDCEIVSLFRRVPGQFGGWMIVIRYHEDEEQLRPKRLFIEIDQRNFDKEFVEFMDGTKERLYLTDGMGDIDFLKRGKRYVISVSPNSGIYEYFIFNERQFNKILTWIKLENDN